MNKLINELVNRQWNLPLNSKINKYRSKEKKDCSQKNNPKSYFLKRLKKI